MNELALFAGAGGGILGGGGGLGWRTVCAVERDAYASQILAQRQNDGILEPFPIWSDITTFNGKPWAGIVDVVSGGFPCQDISAAGKGAGIEGARSGMWKEMARIISEVRPTYAFVENSPMLTTRGLGVVLADLAKMGFDAEWGVLSAADVGAPHRRERIWIVAKQRNILSHTQHNGFGWGQQQQESIEKEDGTMADSKELLCNGINNNARISLERQEKPKPRNSSRSKNVSSTATSSDVADSRCKHGDERNATRLATNTEKRSTSSIHNQPGSEGQLCNTNSENVEGQWKESIRIKSQLGNFSSSSWWQAEPNVGRVADGVAYGMDRLKAIGNGQVPLCATTAFNQLKERLEK
jgi:DNA (cytosine-5)-methyltransferase 1